MHVVHFLACCMIITCRLRWIGSKPASYSFLSRVAESPERLSGSSFPSLPSKETGLIMSFQLSPSLFGHAITLHAMAVAVLWPCKLSLHTIHAPNQGFPLGHVACFSLKRRISSERHRAFQHGSYQSPFQKVSVICPLPRCIADRRAGHSCDGATTPPRQWPRAPHPTMAGG